ncbi:hypothetical protein QVD17_02334 [Tagetes erecta]|uniref:RRM domain-containing protein n=1 Tax=Tagetes erecta TaxID=13708 RepID=A0AAD8LBG4_TARER|nr:hypothetical protein QVD17_02334 [Tagetes erecta]
MRSRKKEWRQRVAPEKPFPPATKDNTLHPKQAETENGEWLDHNGKKIGTTNLKKTSQIISFFVTNFPDDLSSEILRDACRSMGRLTDAFVPKKTKKNDGGKFGFVRFTGVKSTVGLSELSEALNNLKFGGLKLLANLARYDKYGNKINYDFLDEPLQCNVSNYSRPVEPTSPVAVAKVVGLASYKEALASGSGSCVTGDLPAISVSHETDAMRGWYGLSLVGEAKDLDSLRNVNNLTSGGGDGDMVVKYLWGMKILLCFKDAHAASFYLNSMQHLWKIYLSRLVLWEGQHVPMDRIAWVRIRGMPVHLWDRTVFDQVGSLFGKIIFKSEVSLENRVLSYEEIGLLVNSLDPISGKVKVCWKERSYIISVSETDKIWIPDSLAEFSAPSWSSFSTGSPAGSVFETSPPPSSPEKANGYTSNGNMEVEKSAHDSLLDGGSDECSAKKIVNVSNVSSNLDNIKVVVEDALLNNTSSVVEEDVMSKVVADVNASVDGSKDFNNVIKEVGVSKNYLEKSVSSVAGPLNGNGLTNVSNSDPFGIDKFIFRCGPTNKKKRKPNSSPNKFNAGFHMGSRCVKKRTKRGSPSLNNISDSEVNYSNSINNVAAPTIDAGPTLIPQGLVDSNSMLEAEINERNQEVEHPVSGSGCPRVIVSEDPVVEINNTLKVGALVQIDLSNHLEQVRDLITADAEKVVS